MGTHTFSSLPLSSFLISFLSYFVFHALSFIVSFFLLFWSCSVCQDIPHLAARKVEKQKAEEMENKRKKRGRGRRKESPERMDQGK